MKMATYTLIFELYGKKWFFDNKQKVFRNVENPNVSLDVPKWALAHLKFS